MRHAFSLVELSIVLVILGLLTGGILAGQSLIRAAELRSVTANYQRYASAYNAFRDKYMAVPGDMANATGFWGTAAACPGTNATPSLTAATCNGDGNGLVQPSSTANYGNEIYRAWQHLANAGLIEGSFSGVTNDASAANVGYSLIGTNSPASKLSNTGWTIYAWSGPIGLSDLNYFEGNYGNFFFFGRGSPTGASVTYNPALKPEEAWNIDTKLDDGRPATGAVLTREADGGAATDDCSDMAPSAAASLASSGYTLSNTGLYCSLVLKISR